MCLILLGVNPNPTCRLAVAANRDEFYERETAQAGWWEHAPDVLGGRDLRAGGTWLGITRQGRFAAVTNFREDPPDPLPPRSRGELTAGFLLSTESPADYLARVAPLGNEYRGFNLIVADRDEVWYLSNRDGGIKQLSPGFYGLSNQLLDCDWPKVIRGRDQLAALSPEFATASLFELIGNEGDDTPYSRSFIRGEAYGTTASTIVKVGHNGLVEFEERNFLAAGIPDRVHKFTFEASA